MKLFRLSIMALVLLGIAQHSEADAHGWHGGGGGGWHGGGGGWHHGGGWYGGGVIITPGYYYPPYPYYYGNPYYSGYEAPAAYQGSGVGAGSVAIPVQEELTRRGYYHGPIDGVVGPGTRAAISAYQQNHGLEVNGVIDESLLRSLRL